MRHRIKKIPTLSKLDHLLHSDESTYFYNKGLTCSTGIPLLVSICGLLLVLGMMISPLSSASGVDKASAVGQDYGAGRTVSLTILNDNGSEVGDGDTISTTLETPGQVAYISSTLRINTNRIAKYYVGIQAAEDGTSDLIGSTGETITGAGDEVSPDDFGDNTWGYSLTDNTTTANNQLTYSTLPAYKDNSPLQYTSPMNPTDGNHDLKLAFAARINANRPSGHYTTKAMVSVAADPKTLTLSDITYMQDMMPDICASTPEHSTKQLIDKRDDKSYWVTKLKDGNCWMTQNLDLDLSTSEALTPALSDVTENWTPPVTTWKAPFTVWPSDTAQDYSYDVGDYIYTKPTEDNDCGTGITIDTLEKCTGEKGWKNVSGLRPLNDSELTTPMNEDQTEYNAHWLAGNHYSYNIATAGTGVDIDSVGNAASSICPKGWRMMTARGAGSIYDLLSHYGFTWTPIVTDTGWDSLQTALTATHGDKTYHVELSPFYLVPGGGIDNGIAYAGSLGVYWLSTASCRTSLSTSTDYLIADGQFMRASANLVRCVAR